MKDSPKFLTALFFLANLVFAQSAMAAEAESFEITDWQVPGDGKTQTIFQYLDTNGLAAKEAGHQLSATSRGDTGYSFDLTLPPAILAPSIGVSYSSGSEMSSEMSYGWSLNGLVEIRRPLVRAYDADGIEPETWDNEWLISGPGFSGALTQSGNEDGRFFLHTASPTYVIADYDEDQNSWTVYSGGITWTLAAADEGASSSAGTALWRVTQASDNSGNYITYRYNSLHNIQSISYGGNLTTGEDHVITVAFTYGENTTTRTSARAGFLTEYKCHIEKITIQSGNNADSGGTCLDGAVLNTGPSKVSGSSTSTSDTTVDYSSGAASFNASNFSNALNTDSDDAEDNTNRLYAFDLIYTTDSLDLLTKLEHEGKTSLAAETIAEFEYTAFDTAAKARSTSTTMAPSTLGASVSETKRGVIQDSVSQTTKTLVDFNRDGLPDVVNAAGASNAETWQVTNQTVNSTARSFSWDATHTVNVTGDPVGSVTTKGSLTSDPNAPSFTTTQLVDLDGDGYMDIVKSDNVDEWAVSYGNGDGTHHYNGSVVETPPTGWQYAQTAWAVKADSLEISDWTDSDGGADIVQGFLDFNGDGRLDCYDPGKGQVWLKGEERESGWPTRLDLSQTFEALRSVIYTIDSETFTIDSKAACEKNCETDCDEAADDAFDDCYSECSGDCEDTETRSRYIAATDETKAFYDINGDGLADHIDASATPWTVYLNNGYDFESPITWSAPALYTRRSDEGRPDITWDSNEMDIHQTESGRDAKVFQMLLDVDGDGLLDLAMGQSLGHIWYKNTGAGFESSSRALPSWWPDDFITSKSSSAVDGDEGSSEGKGATLSMVMDLDHDGALDNVTTSEVSYGQYPRPYLLQKIKNVQGGSTSVSYRSMATVSPSGSWTDTNSTPIVKHLADVITSTDGLTGESAETDFDYANGYYKDGVFEGFTSRDVTRKINGVWTSQTFYEYALDRDFEPLVTTQKLYTDLNLNFGPTISRGAPVSGLRAQVTNTYGDYGHFYLLKSRKVSEYGEKSGSKDVQYAYNWDNYGNLKSFTNDGGGTTDDAIKTDFTYVADSSDAASAKFYRMKAKTVSGIDPLTGINQVVASEKYYYDGHSSVDTNLTAGLLTRAETDSGWTGGGESLTAKSLALAYTIDSRGRVKTVKDESTGITMDQSYDFGGAVLKTQTNGLGQSLTRTIDNQGRVTSITDPNGLVITPSYDAFGRVTQKTVTDTDGKTSTVATTTYSRTSMPFYTKNEIYNDTGVDQTTYAIEDGFGHSVQSWQQDEGGHFDVTTAISDLRGLVTVTSQPEDKGATFSVPTSSFSVSSELNKNYYDAMGEPREIIRDTSRSAGAAFLYHDSPWQDMSQDESGFQTTLTYDAHHRITKVQQSKKSGSSTTTTATYRYDPMNRLVKFTDGGGTYYTYSYDGAGRLRQVKFGGKTTTSTSWYTYDYKGMLESKMTDNTGASATREYDTLGRITKLTATDSMPSSSGKLTYTWSYDTGWKGAVDKTTDPSGSTKYTYNSLGRIKSTKRSYAVSSLYPTTGKSAEFSFTYDLQGNVTSETMPSGRLFTSTYLHGFLSNQKAATSGTTDYTLTYDYNKWGLLDTVSGGGYTLSSTYTTPLWADAIKMRYGTTEYQRAYTWANNGLMTSRTDSVDTNATSSMTVMSADSGSGSTSATSTTTTSTSFGLDSTTKSSSLTSTTYNYSYDDLMELTGIKTGSGAIVESYAYDAAGNPTAMQDSSGVKWTYATAGKLNQITNRTTTSGIKSEFTYDAAGRVKTWKSSSGTYTYYYDGLGRLRGLTLGGVWQAVYDYDVAGQLVRTADNNPFTSKPYFKYATGNWRYDEKTSTATEHDNGNVSTEFVGTAAGTRKWLFKELDGHVAKTFDDSGTVLSTSNLGGYGDVIDSTGIAWDWNSYQGTEEQVDLFHMGQRHLIQKDGQWLQPEPLLYRGIPQDILGDPLKVATYRYGRNTPTRFQDRSGNAPNVLSVASPYMGFVGQPSFVYDPSSPLNEGDSDQALARQIEHVATYRSTSFLAGWEYSDALANVVFNINPSLFSEGPTGNCSKIVIALADSMKGNAAVARSGDGDLTDEQIIARVGGTPKQSVSGPDEVREIMANLPPGTLGLVFSWTVGGGGRHVQGVFNDDETTWFAEGQQYGAGVGLSTQDRAESTGELATDYYLSIVRPE